MLFVLFFSMKSGGLIWLSFKCLTETWEWYTNNTHWKHPTRTWFWCFVCELGGQSAKSVNMLREKKHTNQLSKRDSHQKTLLSPFPTLGWRHMESGCGRSLGLVTPPSVTCQFAVGRPLFWWFAPKLMVPKMVSSFKRPAEGTERGGDFVRSKGKCFLCTFLGGSVLQDIPTCLHL